MTISLKKGQRISLEKVAPSLVAGFIGLGWDINATDTGTDFDLDASVFLLGANDKLVSDQHFIFYNNLVSPDSENSVKLLGDNSPVMMVLNKCDQPTKELPIKEYSAAFLQQC